MGVTSSFFLPSSSVGEQSQLLLQSSWVGSASWNGVWQNVIFWHKTLCFVNFWSYWGILGPFNPISVIGSLQNLNFGLGGYKTVLHTTLHKKLFNSSTDWKPHKLLSWNSKWPLCVQKWPKFSETLLHKREIDFISQNWEQTDNKQTHKC